MIIVFHEDFIKNYGYESDPAADRGRIKCIRDELCNLFDFTELQPATETVIRLNHSQEHIESIKTNEMTYYMSLLAVGGSIKASELAMKGIPSFALIRPPGHHASPGSCWGFCFFNNIAIAIKKLLSEDKIFNAAIIDFDLHFGDGTNNSFKNNPMVSYFHPSGNSPREFLSNLREYLDGHPPVDILGVSAGFDRGIEDWGKLLSEQDYIEIGKMLRSFSREKSDNHRFAVLEGGYNHKVLGKNVKAFLEGFKNE